MTRKTRAPTCQLGAQSGEDLIAALQACPHPDLELTEEGVPMPVRPVDLTSMLG